ncbi:MAG: sugar transferase [Oscillospiraceae bacterium]|nr:sugar transferase [Oscillospiraceae bacterium]
MSLQGNNIISEEEERIAQHLREKNLGNANRNSEPVKSKQSFYTRFGKRALDLLVSVPAVLVLSPVCLVLTAANLIDMGAPVLYRQTRSGYKGKDFDILKFRSMKNAVGKDGRQLPADQRLTKYGRFIRRFSLDELANFINILKGEMSIIGPRPLPVFYHERMSDRHHMREAVRPGLECPRMIDLSEEELGYYQVQFENDVWYVENISFMTDVKMLLALVKMVFASGERSKHADVGTFFVGYDESGQALSLSMAKERYAERFAELAEAVR